MPGKHREADLRQPEQERGTLYQIESRLPVANQDFLVFWMVDIHWEGYSQRSAPQKRHIGHLRQNVHGTPRKPSSWDGGGYKMHLPT